MRELEKIIDEFDHEFASTFENVKEIYGYDVMIKSLIARAFQAGKSSTIAKIREGMPKKHSDSDKVCYSKGQGCNGECIEGFNQAIDLQEKTINDVESDGNTATIDPEDKE